MKFKRIILFPILLLIIAACSEKKPSAPQDYIDALDGWTEGRIENLKAEDGWLNLEGLFWLEEGENSFGSAEDNDIVFPEGTPEHIGVFTLEDSVITVKIKNDINVLIDSSEIKTAEIKHDMTGNPTIMEYKSYRWFIIKRAGDRYGIRLRNLDSEFAKNFNNIERFPADTTWIVRAKFIRYNPPKKIEIPSVIGNTEEHEIPGYLFFYYEGKEYTLDPIVTPTGFFIIFADRTNGEETYGAGRFLYAQAPVPGKGVMLDFNRAYNPPCAFTKYATCPLPPESNFLDVAVEAGEKKVPHHE